MKNLKSKYFIGCLLLFAMGILSCKNSSSGDKVATPVVEKKNEMSEEMLASSLYQYYHADPQTIDQRDENQLIEYAVDHNVEAIRTPSGLFYTIEALGGGSYVSRGDPVVCDYKGMFLNQKVFDSSYKRGKPLSFKVGQMIAGFNEGLSYMTKGSRAVFLVPSRLAYGKKGFPGLIEPDTPLVFEVELLHE